MVVSNLTENEKKILKGFLDRLGDVMGNAGCNDFDLPDDPALRQAVADYHNSNDPQARAKPCGCVMDFIVLGYLQEKLGL